MTKIYAIAGGIGTGKSTVAKIFVTLGVPIFMADTVAKEICNTNKDLKEKIIDLLGYGAYQEGLYHRKWVSQRIFGNEKLRLALNQLIHPLVHKKMQEWKTSLTQPYALYETALLNASLQQNKVIDGAIIINSPLALRMERVKKRDNRSEIEIIKIIESQPLEADLAKMGQFFINNDENQLLIEQLIQLHNKLMNL